VGNVNKSVLLALAIGLPPRLVAGEFTLNMLGNAEDQSAISGVCTFQHGDQEIRCQTVQIRVNYATDPKDFDKSWKAAVAEIDTEFRTDADVAEFCRKDLSGIESMTSALKHPTEEQKAAIAIGGGAFRDAAALAEMCKHPSRSALRDMAYKQVLADTTRCRVSASLADVDVLKKVSDTKWISVTGPSGLCHVVSTDTLERQDKTSPLWTWTQVASTADNSEVCRKFGITQSVNKPLVFSWKSSWFPMHCETVDFGD
jgi:hypothetical protein